MAKEAGEYKFGVPQLAKDLAIIPASVRVRLRNSNVKKNKDGVYGWNSRADYDAVLKRVKPSVEPAKKSAATKAKKAGKKTVKKAKAKAKSDAGHEARAAA